MAARAEDIADRALLAEAAEAAGQIALGFFQRSPEVWFKSAGGHSPVSEADLAVDRMLRNELLAARPDYGWLSEETADDPARLGRARIFVVDPIDGTRAYLAGETAWTVSLAVVEDGRPVAAALLRPATGDLLTAAAGGGAEGRYGPLSIAAAPAGPLRLAMPRKYMTAPALRTLGGALAPFVPSLALRLSLVASGALEAAVASDRAHDWDLAAADLLVHEAGAFLTDAEGRTPRYNGPSLVHPPLVASIPALHPAMRDLLAAVTGPARGKRGRGRPSQRPDRAPSGEPR